MPLDVLGCTCATMIGASSLIPCPKGLGNLSNAYRDGDRFLQLLILNEEFLVSASHQLVLIASLPFVHTARRSYRLGSPVNYLEQTLVVNTAKFVMLCEPYYLEEGEVVTRFP